MARSPKLSFKEKQSIVNDFVFYGCQGNPDVLNQNSLFTKLAQYANSNGFSGVQYYDFARDNELRSYIKSLYESLHKEEELHIIAYESFDKDYYFAPNITVQERQRRFLEREKYYQKQLSVAQRDKANAVSARQENERLYKENRQLIEENQTLSDTNKMLSAENASLKGYVKKKIEPAEFEKLLEQPIDPATALKNSSLSQTQAYEYKEALKSKLIVLQGGRSDGL